MPAGVYNQIMLFRKKRAHKTFTIGNSGVLSGIARMVKIKNKQKLLYFLTYSASFLLFAIIGGTLLVVVILAAFSVDLPNPNRLLERNTELSTRIFDRNKTPIYEVFGEKNRSVVQLSDVSPALVHATLSAEDSDFYQHKGYSLKGMMRAALNTFTGSGLQGGSTITQQVVKNALLSQERTLTRKIKEAILSLQLENRYAKDEILQMYLNETPYGGQNYGVLTAAKAYFGKNPSELTTAEAAYLAGLPQRPSEYSPFSADPAKGLERKDYVLHLMNSYGWLGKDGARYFLSDEDYKKAKEEKLVFKSAASSFEAPHFVFYVKDLLAKQFGEDLVEQGGLQVVTSLNLDLQKKAEEIVKEELENSKGLNVGNGSLVTLDPKTGQILAMVGSKDYFAQAQPVGCVSGTTGKDSCLLDPKVNVTLRPRQPGSSIKPITYAALLSQGYTASTPLLDVPTRFVGEGVEANKVYAPENYDGNFRGPMSLRKALGNSINLTAVKALKLVGINNMILLARKMGITTFTDFSRYGLSLTLGGGETKLLEMTGAFAMFAAKGVHREPVAILEVRDAQGTVLYKWRDNGGDKVLGEDVAFLISDILSDDGARSDVFGRDSLLNISGHQVAVKTGTTDDKRDNYFMAYTPSLTLGVWVGNSNNEPMNPLIASGITGATPIGNQFMKEALKDQKPERFEPPKNVKKIEVDELTGMLPHGDDGKRPEWFVEGSEPTSVSDWYRELEVCEIDGLIANDACKEADKTDRKSFVKIMAELPEWQGFVDEWVSDKHEDDRYFPPQTVSRLSFTDGEVESRDPMINIVQYKDGDHAPFTFRLGVEVSASDDVEEVKIYLDGEKKTTDKSFPYGYNFEFLPSQSGEHEIRVTAKDKDGRVGEEKLTLRVGER